ncbi:TetR/AcrR family transcriptional regulator, partial [Planctomycetota bacterium]
MSGKQAPANRRKARRGARPKKSGVRAKPRNAYHHGDLRAALVEAALLMVEQGGPKAVTLRGAARMAGVSQTAPYRHFEDKQALLAAVAEEGFRALGAEIGKAAAPLAQDPLERLRALAVAYVCFAAEHPSSFRVMYDPETADRSAHTALAEASNRVFSGIVATVEECQEMGLLRRKSVFDNVVVAWSALHGLASLIVEGQARMLRIDEHSPQSLASLICDRLLEGLGAQDSGVVQIRRHQGSTGHTVG